MKPIIFSQDSIRAIIEGRKTMTRRVVKTTAVKLYRGTGGLCGFFEDRPIGDRLNIIQPPYKPGDILWARETYMICDPSGDWANSTRMATCHYKAGGEVKHIKITSDSQLESRWRSPRYMPKEAARFFLRVKDVRVEQVQEITVGDAFDEGIRLEPPGAMNPLRPADWDKRSEKDKEECVQSQARAAYIAGLEYGQRHIKAYHVLWDSLNAKREKGIYIWDKNPWVWVIEFVQITEEDALKEVI